MSAPTAAESSAEESSAEETSAEETRAESDATAGVEAVVTELAQSARAASRALGRLTTSGKNEVLLAAADAIESASESILAANAEDIARAESSDMEASLLDRLRLTPERVTGIANGLRQVAVLPDPIGEILSGKTLPNGLQLRQVRVPLGVVGIVYEARPNVTVDAFGIAFKSGNAVLLRGSSSCLLYTSPSPRD